MANMEKSINAFKLDDFEIIPWKNKDIIGIGAFSVVYHVKHKQTGQHFALKKVFF